MNENDGVCRLMNYDSDTITEEKAIAKVISDFLSDQKIRKTA
jgi:hypothetical protein